MAVIAPTEHDTRELEDLLLSANGDNNVLARFFESCNWSLRRAEFMNSVYMAYIDVVQEVVNAAGCDLSDAQFRGLVDYICSRGHNFVDKFLAHPEFLADTTNPDFYDLQTAQFHQAAGFWHEPFLEYIVAFRARDIERRKQRRDQKTPRNC